VFCDGQLSSARTLPQAVKEEVLAPERKCRVADIASRREAPWPDPIAAHEKNRQLIEQRQQLVSPSTSSIAILPGACL
jgi:hypothetical protein